MENTIGLKNLRENMTEYLRRVAGGESFIVFKQSKPLFKISPLADESWEEVVDFTKIKKGGVNIKEVLSRL
jgi:antitoxin (DNA-binding transcriptional repressor) of toxin-antitoxin stability system